MSNDTTIIIIKYVRHSTLSEITGVCFTFGEKNHFPFVNLLLLGFTDYAQNDTSFSCLSADQALCHPRVDSAQHSQSQHVLYSLSSNHSTHNFPLSLLSFFVLA